MGKVILESRYRTVEGLLAHIDQVTKEKGVASVSIPMVLIEANSKVPEELLYLYTKYDDGVYAFNTKYNDINKEKGLEPVVKAIIFNGKRVNINDFANIMDGNCLSVGSGNNYIDLNEEIRYVLIDLENDRKKTEVKKSK